jgi:hypothetical protein
MDQTILSIIKNEDITDANNIKDILKREFDTYISRKLEKFVDSKRYSTDIE